MSHIAVLLASPCLVLYCVAHLGPCYAPSYSRRPCQRRGCQFRPSAVAGQCDGHLAFACFVRAHLSHRRAARHPSALALCSFARAGHPAHSTRLRCLGRVQIPCVEVRPGAQLCTRTARTRCVNLAPRRHVDVMHLHDLIGLFGALHSHCHHEWFA